MILQFSVENFQSIRERITLDMRSLSIEEHKESLIQSQYLPVVAIYGPNAGGKSTVLRSIMTLCTLVLLPIMQYSGLSNQLGIPIANKVTPLPFLLDENSRNKPTIFELVLKINNSKFRLYMECLQNKIIYESLEEHKGKGRPALVYKRDIDNIVIVNSNYSDMKGGVRIAEDIPAISYLKQMYNASPIKEIIDCLTRIAGVDYSSSLVEERVKSLIAMTDIDPTLRPDMYKMLEYLNLGIDDFEIQYLDETKRQFKVDTIHNCNGKSYSLLLVMESMGTQKLFNLLPLIIHSLKTGGALIVDELDAKLHPKMLQRVIELYTNPNINKNGAQLLFTSHDLTTMTNKVFRRDEILFAAKDETENTILYSLADIRDEDGARIRSDAVYNRQYFAGRYGADPYFKQIMSWED